MSLDALPHSAAPAPFAIFVAAWDEAAVIGGMLTAAVRRFDYPDYRIYVGTYPNDPATIAAARAVAALDPRVRVIVGERDGPTTKADCLNTVWHALMRDEAAGRITRAVVLHDAEDVVHPAELTVFDALIDDHALVQLPVLPLVRRGSLISGHYADEFAYAHSVQQPVRAMLGAAMPLAGTGCAIATGMLRAIAAERGDAPFDASSLTEDYELYGVQDKTYYVGKIFIPTWQLVLRPTARCGLQPFHIIIAANAVRRRQNWWFTARPLWSAKTAKAALRSGSAGRQLWITMRIGSRPKLMHDPQRGGSQCRF